MALENFDLLTVLDVAKLLHCSKAHVSNLVAGKVHGCSRLPAVRLGRRTLIRPETFVAWVEQNETANGTIKTSPERVRRSA